MATEQERLGSFNFRPSTELVNDIIASLKPSYAAALKPKPVQGMRWFPFVTSWLLPGEVDDATLAKLMIAEMLLGGIGSLSLRAECDAFRTQPRPTELRTPVTSSGAFCDVLGKNMSEWADERLCAPSAQALMARLVREFDDWVRAGCGGSNPFGGGVVPDGYDKQVNSLVMNSAGTGVDLLITNPDYDDEDPVLDPLPPLDEPTK